MYYQRANMNVKKFLDAARAGEVTVEFKKIDTGEVRVMPCTLNSKLSNQNIEIKDQKDDNDHLVVWSLDKDAWRSFRVNTVIEWYVGREKKESNKGSSN